MKTLAIVALLTVSTLFASVASAKQPLQCQTTYVLGGTITVVYGAPQYFGNASDATRFIIVTVGLALLLALGYWRLRDWAKQSPA